MMRPGTAQPPLQPFRRAFTLVELVLVLAIAGVIAAMAAPRFIGASERYRVRLAADRVMRDITYARSRALSLGAQQTISFTDASRQFTIAGMENPDNAAQTYVVRLTAEPYRIGKLATDFGGAASLTFNGFGVPSSAGTVTVQSGRFAITVVVAAGSGVCSIGTTDGNASHVSAVD